MTDHERAAYYGDTGDLGGANLLAFSKLLECGHRVEASEESGGFDEVAHVTESMVRALLKFRIDIHDCVATDARLARYNCRRIEGTPFSQHAGPF